jgi:hypothetical protein
VRRAALLASVILAVGAYGLARVSAPPPARSVPAASAPEPAPSALPPAPPLARNPFQYAPAPRDSVASRRAIAAGARPAPGALPAPAQPPAARLVGFVRQSGSLRAALVLNGQMALLAVGESAEGFTLLAADEENGVRLRGSGGEIALALEP